MKCNQCGSDIEAGVRFCTSCGASVPEEKKSQENGASAKLVSGLKMSGSLADMRNASGQDTRSRQQILSAAEETRQKQGSAIEVNQSSGQEVRLKEKTTQTLSVKNSRVIAPVQRSEEQAYTPPPVPPIIPIAPMPKPVASCAGCGASIPADKIYCDRCSAIDDSGDVDKSHFGIIIGIIVGVLVLILGGIAFMFRDKIGGLFSRDPNENDSFEAVHSALIELVEDENFQSSDAGERCDMAMDVLDELEEDDLIDGDTVDNSDGDYLYFELFDGTECLIELETPENSDYMGNPGTASIGGYTSGRFMTYPEDVSALSEPFSEGSRSALIIDGTGDDEIGRKLAEYASDWSKCYLDSKVSNDFTIEDFRYKLGDYSYVDIFCHGIFLDGSNRFYIRTSEEVTVKSMKKYSDDASSRRIALGYFPGRADYLVKPSLFEEYYGDGGLSDTILWFSSCYSMKTNEIEKALEGTKCPAIAGVDGIISAEYDIHMQDATINHMMRGSSFYDSLTMAMTELKELGEAPPDGTNIKFLGEKTTVLFTLTEDAAEELKKAEIKSGKVTLKLEYDDGTPVSGAKISVSGSLQTGGEFEYGAANVNGSETIVMEEGSYTIRVSVDSKETTVVRDVKFDIDNDGNIVDLVLPAIIIEAPEKYADIVNAAYDSFSVWVRNMTVDYGVTDDFYFWFQDMDMDGTAEFIVGPAVTGAHACHSFVVWEEKNGKLVQSSKFYNSEYASNEILMWHNYGTGMDFTRPSSNADSFYLYLYKKNGEYIYIYPSSDGDAFSTVMLVNSISCSGGDMTEEFRIDQTADGDNFYVKGKKVSADQFKESYESYCSELTPVTTFTEKLSYNSLKTADEKTLKEKLSSSYDTWAVKDASGSVNLGFNTYIKSVGDATKPTAADDGCIMFTAMVNTEEDPLNVREQPSKDAKVIGQFEKGELIDVYSEADGWCEVRYDGKVGYVSKEYIQAFVGGVAKPVIYLYPERKQDVSVKVNFRDGWFTCTYPNYGSGWNVTAYPDGRIINKADGDEYSYLYWEGSQAMELDFSEGFVVRREDTAAFLKEKLSFMGLTPKEYNEFIVYWLPIMQKNEYNLISFQWENYDESAKLEISPKPDSMLRVFMAFKAADENTNVPEQKLEKFKRRGFAVVEWGGTEVKSEQKK